MQLHYRYASSQVASLSAVVDLLPDAALARPTRSTVPLLRYWRKPAERLAYLGESLNRRLPDDLTLAFEYATPVRSGRGKASFTDLMVLGEGISIAIEAKYTEPEYESTTEWFGPQPTENRRQVLGGWLAAIKAVTGADLAGLVGALPYQLIHRTASVCCAPGPSRAVIYQVFGYPAAHYSKAMAALLALLRPECPISFYLHSCPYEPTGLWAPVRQGAAGRPTPSDLRQAMLADTEELALGTMVAVAV